MEIAKLKYYSTERLYDSLDEIENGDGGRGMKDLMLAEHIKDLIEIRENNPDGAYKKVAREQFGFVL